MIAAAPGASFETVVQGFPTGLAGTVGVQVIDNIGGVTIARVTTAVERPASSGIYAITLTAPAASGQYTIVWDQGTITPSTTATDDLVVTVASVTTTTTTGTWTYDPSQLATSELFRVRFEIADTDANAPLLVDAEVNQAISVERNQWGAAARCCEVISRNFLRKADVRIGRGGTTLTYSVAAKQYAEMATAFRKRANGMVAPWTGGTSVDDKNTLASDDSLVQPLFTKRMFSDPWTGGTNGNSVIEDQD